MTKTFKALILCVAVLVLAVPGAQAQAPTGPGGMEQGGMMHMMGMMQQMGGMMKQMSAMMAGGQMGPDQMKPMGEMMGTK